MHLTTRNVNTAFRDLVGLFNKEVWVKSGEYPTITRSPSRNGQVLKIEEPITITYTHPKERVLFNSVRDANPFALLYEALWMLAGRNDVASLAYYSKNFANYSDDGKTLNGAYGYRWRNARAGNYPITSPMENDGYRCGGGHRKEVGQLQLLVAHLKADPNSRRAVLQMWNVEDDLLKIGLKCVHCINGTVDAGPLDSTQITCPKCQGAAKGSKDVCCNLSVLLSLREVGKIFGPGDVTYKGSERVRDTMEVSHSFEVSKTTPVKVLDMTVINRSNDLVWGLTGANYVTFSILQEYMAAHLGVEVGKYHHMTNNLHVYDDPGNPKVAPWEPEKWLECESGEAQRQYHPDIRHVPLVKDPAVFDKEVVEFVEMYSGKPKETCDDVLWTDPFLVNVAEPMMRAFLFHKLGHPPSAEMYLKYVKADDWRTAATSWLQRRKDRAAMSSV